MDNCFNFITTPVSPQPAACFTPPGNRAPCKKPSFAFQKAVFYRAICHLLQGERRPFAKPHIITCLFLK